MQEIFPPYSRDINGVYERKPHIVLTVAERNFTEDGGRTGLLEIIENAIKNGRVISFDTEKRDYLSVNTKAISLGIITEQSLNKNQALFRKEIKVLREKNDINYSARKGESNRSLLVNAPENTLHHEVEKTTLDKYKALIPKIEELEAHLREVNGKLRELYFAKGPRDTAQIEQLREDATKTANRIDILDKQLLRLEATAPLMRVLEREYFMKVMLCLKL